MKFDYQLDFTNIDFPQHPELYAIGKGAQGVLMVEPYKSEILPYWRFKTPEIARQSAYDKWQQAKVDLKYLELAQQHQELGNRANVDRLGN